MKVRRIWAIVLRQFYLHRRSPSRILDLFYWPTVDLLLWGFVTIYLETSTTRLPEFVLPWGPNPLEYTLEGPTRYLGLFFGRRLGQEPGQSLRFSPFHR